MIEQATRYILSLTTRLNKIFRRQEAMDIESAGDAAMFGMLFRELEKQDGSARIRMTDVSQYLMISKPAATQSVNRLVERGLLQRTRDENDRRVVYIAMTEDGKRLLDEKLNEKMRFIERAVNRIGVEKAAQLGSLLDELIDALLAEMEEK